MRHARCQSRGSRFGIAARALVVALSVAALVVMAGVAAYYWTDWFNPPPPWSPEMQTVADGNNQFAFDLYGKLREDEKGNIFCSPYSVHTALTMATTGANGNTREQMVKALHLPGEQSALASGDLAKFYTRGRKPYQLSVANALWGQKGAAWQPEFLKIQKKHFDAAFREADFATNPDGERQRINSWAEEETRGKIKDLLPSGSIDDQTAMVLANAVYFKGNWDQQFDKVATNDRPFFLADGGTVTVPLMHQEKCRCRYAALDGFQVLELPYKGGDLSMVVILPKKHDGLPEIEKQLTAANLAKWLEATQEKKEFSVYIPRFRMEQAESLDLVKPLGALGMVDAFDPHRADFTRMLSSSPVYINHVMHKAFVEVNEEGTEAAAATAATFQPVSASIKPEFRADRPFIFLIRDRPHSTILFLGRFVKPAA